MHSNQFFMLAGGALLFAACGVNQDVHDKALADLKKAQTDLQATQSGLDAAKKEAEECKAERAETTEELQAKLQETKGMQEQTSADLAAAKTDLQATASELEELRKQRAAAEKRLAAYRKLNERLRELVDTGKLNVSFRHGQMVVGLPAEILFPSGKANLSKKGKGALAEIADVLLAFKDRRFMIAGHTDNQKLRGKRTNWHLSTARAVSVLEFFIERGFTPENLAAAGYGEFDPVADNESKEGRQQNRRIEVILVPDLSELPKLADEPETAEG